MEFTWRKTIIASISTQLKSFEAIPHITTLEIVHIKNHWCFGQVNLFNEAAIFFQLWSPLLNFTIQKRKLTSQTGTEKHKNTQVTLLTRHVLDIIRLHWSQLSWVTALDVFDLVAVEREAQRAERTSKHRLDVTFVPLVPPQRALVSINSAAARAFVEFWK